MELHSRSSPEAAISEFGGHARICCDGQFAVLPKVVIGFLTVGKSTLGSHMPSPSTVIWRPGRGDYAPSENIPWFPAAVREVYDRSGRTTVQLRHHHIFVRAVGAPDFVYAGEADLGSYTQPRGNELEKCEAMFALIRKVPRDVWLQCGGYDGWLIETNHEQRVIAQGHPMGLEQALNQLSEQDYSHLSMTRYEEDSLNVYTNPRCAWLMYLRAPDDSGLYLDDPSQGSDDEHFQCACGISLDFPASQTVSHSRAATIARHYFETGELPTDVSWSHR